MTKILTKRRLFLGLVFVGLVSAGLAARVFLTGLAVGAALQAAGASGVQFHVTQASPWRVAVEDIGFLVQRQPFSAKRASLDRAHWWIPSLGRVRVEQARVELKADALAKSVPPAAAAASTRGPVHLPLQELSVDGVLIIQANGATDQALAVKFEAKPASPGHWSAQTQVTAPGLVLKGEGTYELASGNMAFTLPELLLDLKTWHDFLQKLVPSPAAGLAADLKLTGRLAGQLAGGKLAGGGDVTIRGADGVDHPLKLVVDASRITSARWSGHARVTASGLVLKGEGTYDAANGDLAFRLPEVAVDLKTWQGFVQPALPTSLEAWQAEGKLSGSIEIQRATDQVTARGKIELREGRGSSSTQAVTAEGVEADLDFTDLAGFVTKPGSLRIRELRTGQLSLRDLQWDFAFAGVDRIDVARVSLLALGGRISAEPFQLVPSRAELAAVLLVDDISVAEVLALTKDLPAAATGRVNGRVPVQISGDGFYFGTGWLELKPGVHAEIQFKAKGLLTGGVPPQSANYAVLQQVEAGLLKLKLNELRLDIRPAQVPEGRTAQLRLKGEPLDPQAKLPVNLNLELNVNGPLEEMLNMGMNSRVNFGGGR